MNQAATKPEHFEKLRRKRPDLNGTAAFDHECRLLYRSTGFLYEASLEEGLGKKKRRNGLRLGRFLPIR